MAKIRSTSVEEKAKKKEHIKACALTLYHKAGELSSVDKIVKKSGLAKGTFYLYFKTKEEVYLDILSDMYAVYLEDVFKGIDPNKVSLESLADSLVKPLVGNSDFLRLASIGPGILEKNVSEEKIIEFKLMLMQAMQKMGEVFLQLSPGLKPEKVSEVIVVSFSLIIGIFQQSDISGELKKLSEKPEIKDLFIDFENITSRSLVALWKGWII